MTGKKKLVGVYLPISLIEKLKTFIHEQYLKTGKEKSHSQVIEDALGTYLDTESGKTGAD